MRSQHLLSVVLASALAGGVTFAQVGRGGSEWLTAQADAQRTSWIPNEPRVSVELMSKPGFALQWTSKLDNQPRGLNGLAQGVTANGVTLFVPMSVVAGSANTVYGIDNDLGYVVWKRQFDAQAPAGTAECPGGITAAATRIVSLVPPPIATGAGGGGRGAAGAGYRSVVGEPGEGVPVESRGGGAGRGAGAAPGGGAGRGVGAAAAVGDPAGAGARGGGRAAGAAPAPGAPATPGAPAAPGAPARHPASVALLAAAVAAQTRRFLARLQEQLGGGGGLGRPAGVAYVISSDGVLHVVGLPSGKDIQRPGQFLPPEHSMVRPHRGRNRDVRIHVRQLRWCTEWRVGERSSGSVAAGHVVAHERRQRRRPCRIHHDGNPHCGDRSGSDHGRRQGQCDRGARSRDAGDQGLVHAADRQSS